MSALIPDSPRWVVYSDEWVPGTERPPYPSQIAGFNVFILSFLLTSGPADKALEFTLLDAKTRSRIIDDYHANGISLMVAAFGATDAPTSTKKDPEKMADMVADFVKKYDLDGVDVDYEDFNAIDSGTGRAETWLINFTKALRKALPYGEYIITHAPIAPWFTTNTTAYPFGAYRAVNVAVGSMIDWYNVQYYNQDSSYSNCSTILTTSGPPYPRTSVQEINSFTGVPLEKILIGKPASPRDTDSGGYMPISELRDCLKESKETGWNGGAMFWQYPRANSSFLRKVTKGSWNVGGKGASSSDEDDEDHSSKDPQGAGSDSDKKGNVKGGRTALGGGDVKEGDASVLGKIRGHKLGLTNLLPSARH